jgi:hypothetical protein
VKEWERVKVWSNNKLRKKFSYLIYELRFSSLALQLGMTLIVKA